ncbi:MAG: choice-of-anchor A family protein, partial [Planctomycetota bacterium]|nr:choice-of-anchor A family protein [Planctomycetota bacterium]
MVIRSQFAAACAASVLSASAMAAGTFTDFNLAVRGNLDSTSEVEGRTAIGGNLSGSASNYGIRLTPPSAYLSVDSVIVGGNIGVQNMNVNAGNVRHGGTRSGNINMNGGGSVIADSAAGSAVSAFASQMVSASSFLRGLSATNTVTIPSSQPGPVNFSAIAGGNGIAVFNVSGAALFSNNRVQQMDIALNDASSVIINVSGTSINWTDGNFVGGFTSAFARSHVLWNFYEATSINLGGRAFNGALLAPAASV